LSPAAAPERPAANKEFVMKTRMRACLLAIGALALGALGGCVVVPESGGYGGGHTHADGYRRAGWGHERVVYVTRGDPNCR
jgi:hypothetical protein